MIIPCSILCIEHGEFGQVPRMIEARRRLEKLGSRGWTLLAAFAFGLVGAIVATILLAIFFGVNLLDSSSSNLAVGSPYVVSAWLSGGFFGGFAWWVLVEKPTSASDERGLAAGAVAMLAAQLLTYVIPVAWGIASGRSPPAVSDLPGTPLDHLVSNTVFTLFLVFPISLPAAGLVGRTLVRRRRRQIGEGRTIDVRKYLSDLSSAGWTLLAGASFGLGGMTAAIVVLWIFFPLLAIAPLLAPGVGIAAFITGAAVWWVVVEVRGSTLESTGVVVGALTAVLTPFILPSLSYLVSQRGPEAHPSLVTGFVNEVVIPGTLLVLFSWIITVPVGAYIGSRLFELRWSVMDDVPTPGNGESAAE